MKKTLIFLSLFFVSFSGTFAYEVTDNDLGVLNKVYSRIDSILQKSPSKAENIRKSLSGLSEKYKNDERVSFLLSTIIQYTVGNYIFKVSSITDGDTISIFMKGKETKIRMIGIDSPESYTTRYGYKECYGDEASTYLKNLLNGKEVSIEYDEKSGNLDKYGRTLAYVFLDGVNVNNKEIADGYAWEYTYNNIMYKYRDTFLESQKNAKETNLGLWAKGTCGGERLPVETQTPVVQETKTTDKVYILGPRGGCYYMSGTEKVYVYDKSLCN